MLQHPSQPTSPSRTLPYSLHQLKTHQESSPAEFSSWPESDAQGDYVYSSPVVQSQETFLDGPYNAGAQFANLGAAFNYPSYAEPMAGSLGTTGSLGSELSAFDAESPYSQPDNGRSTPMSAVSYAASGRAGSGRSTTKSSSPGLASSISSSRVTKSKPKKAKTSKAVVGRYKPLDIPLSQWANENGVQPRDVEAAIERSLETRRAEAASRKDKKAGRPMNQFMLYRSAYTPVAQRYCEEDGRNHQLVSKLSGESWAIEPESVKAKFGRLAKRERERHSLAFPQYKFTPKNRDRLDDEDEMLDNDPDGTYLPGRRFAIPPSSHGAQPETYMSGMYGAQYGMRDSHYDFDHGMAAPGSFDMATMQQQQQAFMPSSAGHNNGFFGSSSFPGALPLSPMTRATDQAPFDSLASMPSSGDFFNGQGPFPGHMSYGQGQFGGDLGEFEPLHQHGQQQSLEHGIFHAGSDFAGFGHGGGYFEQDSKQLMSQSHQ